MFDFQEFHTPVRETHSMANLQNVHIIAHLFNSPVASDWSRSISAIKVGHLLVIVKREYSSDDKVAFGHKARLKVVLDHTHTCCRKNGDAEGTEERKPNDVEWSNLSQHPETPQTDWGEANASPTVLLLPLIDDVIRFKCGDLPLLLCWIVSREFWSSEHAQTRIERSSAYLLNPSVLWKHWWRVHFSSRGGHFTLLRAYFS